jgi:hypothetical protein
MVPGNLLRVITYLYSGDLDVFVKMGITEWGNKGYVY